MTDKQSIRGMIDQARKDVEGIREPAERVAQSNNASERTVFENASNGHREELPSMAWLWAFLFGGLYLLVKGLFTHAVIWVAVSVVAFAALGPLGAIVTFIMGIAYAANIHSLLKAKYLRDGWKEVGSQLPQAKQRVPDSVADEIRKLAQLKADGLLSEEEFDAQKHRLLS